MRRAPGRPAVHLSGSMPGPSGVGGKPTVVRAGEVEARTSAVAVQHPELFRPATEADLAN